MDAFEISGTVEDFRREQEFGPYLPTRTYQFRATAPPVILPDG